MDGSKGRVDKVPASTPPSLPIWLAKTYSRYDDADDVQFSLPSGDDGAFFSLNFENEDNFAETTAHQSTFDKINQELGIPKPGSGDRKVSVSGVTASSLKSSGSSGRLELQQQPITASDHQLTSSTNDTLNQHHQVTPLLVIQSPFSIASAATPDSSTKQEEDETNLTRELIEYQEGENETRNMLIEEEKDSIRAQLAPIPSSGGLVSKVKNLIFKTPQTSPKTTPKAKRKIIAPAFNYLDPVKSVESAKSASPEAKSCEYTSTGGIVVDRKMPTFNSFFYRPSDGGSAANQQVAVASEGSVGVQPVQPRSAAAQQSEQQQLVAAASTTVNQRQRRPKPSRLREMNFWAPTSM